MAMLALLPDTYSETRESLRTLACYVIAPARKASDAHISLVPVAGGFGTPPLDGGGALLAQGDRLRWLPGDETPITTLRAAAAFAGIELASDPGVGHDLPPFRPDEPLPIDVAASAALGAWFELGGAVLGDFGAAQLWPEHFDLATVAEVETGAKVNLGFSPGDGFHAAPYVYVGPHDMSGLQGDFWNAPFGAVLGYDDVRAAAETVAACSQFLHTGLDLVRNA